MLETSMEAIANGGQPIAKCELAMLPILLYQDSEHIAGRDIIWLVDNTAALRGIVKGASGLAVSEVLIASILLDKGVRTESAPVGRVYRFSRKLERRDQSRIRQRPVQPQTPLCHAWY